MSKGLARRIWIGLAGALLLSVCFFVFRRPATSFAPLPNPNGYEILVQAASGIPELSLSVNQLSSDDLASFVDTNREVLVQIRRGLQLPSAVPVEMSDDWSQNNLTNLANLRRAFHLLDAEGLLLTKKGNVTGAADANLDVQRYSQAISRGGLQLNSIVGVASEAMAIARLNALLPDLDPTECKRITSVLQEHESKREPLEDILRREREWNWKTYGIDRIQSMIGTLFSQFRARSLSNRATAYYDKNVLENRVTMMRFAVRAFELEKGRKPDRASELVPDYLPSAPSDPASGEPLELPGAAR